MRKKMIRRGLTVMAWLAGFAALTYTDVVTPLAQRALGAEVVDERVEKRWDVDPAGEGFAHPATESCENTTVTVEAWRAGRT